MKKLGARDRVSLLNWKESYGGVYLCKPVPTSLSFEFHISRWETRIPTFPVSPIVLKVKYGHTCKSLYHLSILQKYTVLLKALPQKPQNAKTVFLSSQSLPILNQSSAKWSSWRNCCLSLKYLEFLCLNFRILFRPENVF